MICILPYYLYSGFVLVFENSTQIKCTYLLPLCVFYTTCEWIRNLQSRSFRNLYNFFIMLHWEEHHSTRWGFFQIRTMKLVVVYCTVFSQSWFLRHTLFWRFLEEKTVHLLFISVKWAWQPSSFGHTHVLFSLLFAVYVIIWATFQRTDQINCITFREKSGIGLFLDLLKIFWNLCQVGRKDFLQLP